MPHALVNGITLHYRIDVAANHAAPWLVLSNSLGSDLSMWAPQITAFAQHFRVLRYDTRGHGHSDAPRGPYSIEQLCDDVIGLLDALKIERAHFCGLSMGGLTGVALGARHGHRFERLVLCNTAARIGSPQVWKPRAANCRANGMPAMADTILPRWFTPGFMAREPLVIAQMRDVLAHTDSEGYAANCDAIDATDLASEVASIAAPTLVIAGTHDPAAPPAQGRQLATALPRGRYAELDASHLSNIELAELFTHTVLDFLQAPA